MYVAVPLPASVVTLHTHAGCAARPAAGHAVAGSHGACPAAPPAQKKPGAQTVGVALVAPAAHPYPAAATAHGAQTAADAADHDPAAQSVGAADPAGQ